MFVSSVRCPSVSNLTCASAALSPGGRSRNRVLDIPLRLLGAAAVLPQVPGALQVDFNVEQTAEPVGTDRVARGLGWRAGEARHGHPAVTRKVRQGEGRFAECFGYGTDPQ